MAVANLNNDGLQVDLGNDSIVIVENLETIPGGRTLDTTGYTPDVIRAGHVVILSDDGEYKPMPLNAGATAYAALPQDHTYAGIVVASVPASKPMVVIMVRGTVIPEASPYPLTSILTAVQAALPLIRFAAD